jgi:ABC-2 type transport system ATP-binding protein
MRQRLGMAAALLRSPRLLLLDEPTNTLDPSGARDLRAHVRRLAEEGAAVLLSSHDMAEVEDLCSVLTIVHRGRVVFSGTAEQLRKHAPAAVHRLSTSDDQRAAAIGTTQPDVQITSPIDGHGLDVCADETALDRLVIELGREGVAIRSLESKDHSLSSLFLKLTEDANHEAAGPGPQTDSTPREPLSQGPPRRALGPVSARGVAAAARVEPAPLRSSSP